MYGAEILVMNDYSEIQKKRVIARGSFGDVFKSVYEGEKVAVKEITNRGKKNQYRNIEEFFARVKREFETICRLNHPNIVKLLNIRFKNNNVKAFAYLTMEYCSGDTLYELINNEEKFKHLDLYAKIRIMRRMLDALLYLSGERIVHRDLKPSNIIFARKGDFDSLKLIDFGFSRYWDNDDEELTKCGTEDYMCPEFKNESRMREKYDYKTPAPDVWACGIIFYELIYGKRPFGDFFKKIDLPETDSFGKAIPSRLREIISSKLKKKNLKRLLKKIL